MGRTGRCRLLYGLLALSVLSWSVSPAAGEVRRPPNYHHVPETSFTCAGKVVGGYYADPDADCQMFHVCVQVDENDVRDFKFMCPNDTVFDQENFICANWFEIDCRSSTLYYDKNLQLFQPGAGSSSVTSSTTEEPSEQQKRQQEQQLKQLMVLEEQQQAQVLRQQQVLEQHERRQQEHQRNQLKILQDQQKRLEQQQGRKLYGNSRTTTTTTTTTTTPYPEETGEESVIEYDYYYYDYEESAEHGNFYANDEYDPNNPTRIIDPTNARPSLLPISPPVKTPINPSTSTEKSYRQ